MNIEDLKIIPPEGMEWYQEGNEIKFRPKKRIDKQEVYRTLFSNEDAWRPTDYGVVQKFAKTPNWNYTTNCTSEKQAQKLLAINQLMNIAKYLNENWIPDWEEGNSEFKYYIQIYHKKLSISYTTHYNGSIVYFKSEKLAQKAIEILGEDLIYSTLSTDW